ncbi:MAG: glycosyltransferase family 1 protein [Deltaproteobacteria bacterium]|nr:glycosyltransferase family 1 protein [Deltaproteobacteria bacterium]
MKIGVITWGSEGDVRPFMALAGGLVRAGHAVDFVYTSVEGRDWRAAVAGMGCRVTALGEAHVARARTGAERALREAVLKADPIKQVQVVSEQLLEPMVEELWAESVRLVRDNDVVVAHFLVHPAITAAAKVQRPVVPVFTAPVLPTRAFPPLGMPDLGFLNGVGWWASAKLANRLFTGPINALRRREGVPLLTNVYDDHATPMPVILVTVSPTLVPRPADWPPEVDVCGFLNAPAALHPEPLPDGLDAFISAGPPPVYLTLGSMMLVGDEEPAVATRFLLDAASRSGARAILQAPWDTLPAMDVPADVFKVTRADHARVFPGCAAVVHHGGAGTTQAACVAGVPSVLVPYIADQFFWATALRKRGVAPAAVPRRKIRADTLAARIREAVQDAGMRTRARAVGEAMRAEDGVARAVERLGALEKH